MCIGCPGNMTGHTLDVYVAALERLNAAARREFVKAAAPELLERLGPFLDNPPKGAQVGTSSTPAPRGRTVRT